MIDYLTTAILSLRPNSEFTISNNDYSTIVWHILEGSAPTQSEIDIAIEQVKVKELAETKAKATARQALLARLGITAEEATLLLS